MALRFILGRAGSGKTHTCLEEIRRVLRLDPWGPPLLFLVPEQATFLMEYALALTPGLPGSVRAEVTSFRRLAAAVLAATGGPERPLLGELGRQMWLRLLLRRLEGRLRLFGAAAGRPGFAGQLAACLQELRRYRLTPERLEACLAQMQAEAAGAEPALAAKLADLVLLWRSYEAFLANRYTDPDTLLDLAAQRLEESRPYAGALLWIDGFAGFTPQEYRVLAALFPQAREVTVALCLDGEEVALPAVETSLFAPTQETYARLRELADRLKLEWEEVRLPAPGASPGSDGRGKKAPLPRFREKAALAHLEREFARPRPRAFPGEPEGLCLVAAPDPWAEVAGAAATLQRLARNGYRYREMAIIVRQLADYRPVLELVLRAHGIPYFLDARRSALAHPLARLLLAALEVVTEGWSAEAVFRCLKTDFWPFPRDAIDRLENYVLACGIKGKDWRREEPWAFPAPPGAGCACGARPAYFDGLRRQIVRLFGPLGEIKPGARLAGRAWLTALWQLLENLQAAATLERWQEEATAQGAPDLAEEHGQVWQGVLRLSEELVEVLGEELLTAEEFTALVRSGLEGLSLGLIPPSLDQVLVGEVERSRQPELRAAFVLGVNEGLFPARLSEEGLFGDAERETLSAYGVELAPSCRRRLFAEEFLAYIAFTRARHFLWVSYTLADAAGRPRRPSPLIARLRRLFPALAETTPPQPARVRAAAAAAPPPAPAPPLPPALVRRLYPEPRYCSVSQLETFARCPFAHFAAYGLELRPRVEARLDRPATGLLLHEALYRVGRELARRRIAWKDLVEAEGEALARAQVEALVREKALPTVHASYFARVVARAVNLLVTHARAGAFVPVALEAAFGPHGPWQPLELEAGDGPAYLVGRIDRVEAARAGNTWYVRVIDYKTGRGAGELPGAPGEEFQLVLYLAAARANAREWLPGEGEAVPAGFFTLPVVEPSLLARRPLEPGEAQQARQRQLRLQGRLVGEEEVIRLMAGERVEELLPLSLKRDGTLGPPARLLSREQMEDLLARARERAGELAAAVYRGEIEAKPLRWGGATACRTCPFPAVCRRERGQ